jgi:hypothetical protein
MAAVSRSRRSIAGIVMLVSGALLVLALLLPQLGVSGAPWLAAIAYIALVVALLILAFGAVNSTLTKVLLIVAAVGWAVLALNALGLAFPAVLVTISALVAGIALLIAAIVLYVGKEVRNLPALLFIITAALGLLYLLGVIGTLALGATLALVIALAFGAGLIITGVLFAQKERGR